METNEYKHYCLENVRAFQTLLLRYRTYFPVHKWKCICILLKLHNSLVRKKFVSAYGQPDILNSQLVLYFSVCFPNEVSEIFHAIFKEV